jgi:hypothetical protein
MTSGLMQPGPTLYEAEQQRKKKGSRGLLGEIGEPLSYAPGPLGLLGNALLSAQYATGEKPMDEGLSALAMLTAMMQGTKVAPIMRNAIKVYHGSSHKFDKADSSKIGTGEGAQSYGHGLYWAENPEVAKNYAKPQAGQKLSVHLSTGQEFKNGSDEMVALFNNHGKTVGEVQAELKKLSQDFAGSSTEQVFKRQYDSIKDLPSSAKIEQNHLYEASLRWPDPAREAADPLSAKHFLDWDKPLSEQPEVLRKVYEKGLNHSLRRIDIIKDVGAFSGSDLVSALGKNEMATARLRELGIPGIAYLDAGSRAAGEGTRNYVTFDDALVELLKRNGVGLLGK